MIEMLDRNDDNKDIQEFVDYLNENMLTTAPCTLEVKKDYACIGTKELGYGFGCYMSDPEKNKYEILIAGKNMPNMELSKEEFLCAQLEDIAHEYYHHYQNVKGILNNPEYSSDFIEEQCEDYAKEMVENYCKLLDNPYKIMKPAEINISTD